jgi:hypothetical protein
VSESASPSVSLSPSVSESPSASPSVGGSISPSLSPSVSASPSESDGSESPSPSAAHSTSPSISPSVSPSLPPVVIDIPIFNKNPRFINRELKVNNRTIANSRFNTIPSWNNLGRPSLVKIGTLGFNIQTEALEFWNGTKWLTLKMFRIKNEKGLIYNVTWK